MAFSKMAPQAAGLLHPPIASAQPDVAAHEGAGKAKPGVWPGGMRLGSARAGLGQLPPLWAGEGLRAPAGWQPPCPAQLCPRQPLHSAGSLPAAHRHSGCSLPGPGRDHPCLPARGRKTLGAGAPSLSPGWGHPPAAPADLSLSAACGCCGTLPISATRAHIRSPEKQQRSAVAQGERERELSVCHLQQRDRINSSR